jgi:hypothetical protein
MRAKVFLGLLTAGLTLAVPALAETPKRVATVESDGVEVRSGKALSFASVGKLPKGEQVIVVQEEETGFLAITPPAGSKSWVKQIHLDKVKADQAGKANVAVLVDQADIVAGNAKGDQPLPRITTQLPKGTIVEVVGPSVRVDNVTWYPITPPDGDLRWIPKNAVRLGAMTALASPPAYESTNPGATPGTLASNSGNSGMDAKPAVGSLPKVLTDHRLYNQAVQAERTSDFATAKQLYARIYQDLWDTKAERDAIVICYNRFTRCEEALKRGDSRGETRDSRMSPIPTNNTSNNSSTSNASDSKKSDNGGQWSGAGYLQELQKVFVDGQQVYSLQDDRGNVLYYATSVSGINLKTYNNRRVKLYGLVQQRPELYRPHLAVERVEVAR